MTPLLCRLRLLLATALCVFLPLAAVAKPKPVAVSFPSGIHHEAWDALLKKYVDAKGLVNYAKWKADAADRKALQDYLAQYAPKAETPAKGDELFADGINAYNAFAINWILDNYPTESIWALSDSFGRKAHLIGGEKVALDDIENGTLRPTFGYRTHTALVCCARSCPPLQRSAYTAAGLSGQLGTAFNTWLGRDDLNHYEPDKNQVQVSSIFKWFKADFEAAGGVPKILGTYGPSDKRDFLRKGGYKIDYLPYRWGLNDQGGHGENYSSSKMLFDYFLK